MPCITQVRTPSAKALTQKVAVSEGGGRPLALSDGRQSLTKRDRQIGVFQSQRCILHRGRDHSHEDPVAVEDVFCGIIFYFVPTPVPISKAVNIPAEKIAVDKG